MIGTIIVSGGGSGGHIYPALAVAEELREEFEVLFVGAAGHLEEELVPRSGVPFRALKVSGFNRKRLGERILSLAKTVVALGASLSLVRRLRPVAVLGTGGYVTVPVGLAAYLSGAPLFILEANATFGLANRVLLGPATRIFLAFPAAVGEIPEHLAAKTVVSGFPVRRAIVAAKREEARQALRLAEEDVLILVTGGSQGAEALNRAAAMVAHSGLPVRLLWATGERYYARWRSLASRTVDVRPYIHDMPQALAASDLVVARAGSSTLSEITARGLPSLLIPSPNVPDDHQRKNALFLERLGAARVVDEEDLERHFLPTLAEVLRPERLRAMAEAARRAGHPDAAKRIAQEIRKVVAERPWRSTES